jgi:hypothetical protein
MGGRAKQAEAMPGQEDQKKEIGLVEAIEAVRAELTRAVTENTDKEIQFPVDKVDLEFHVGVTRSADAGGGIRIWVIELGGKASRETESVQTVKVSLGAPVDPQGKTIKVMRTLSSKP